MNLAERADLTESVIVRYRRKPFDWRNASTCIHLARAQMRAMGHKPPTIPQFRSPIGARRALKAAGFDDVASLLDSMLPRITPASMLVGDLAVLPGDDTFDAILVNAGGTLIGWHGAVDSPGVVPIKSYHRHLIGAWRL